MLLRSLLIALSFCALFAPSAHAKIFRNAYVSFELPEKWDCVLEQTEWVCRPTDPAIARQAIIILTAKEVGPMDSLAQYTSHLQTPRTIASRTGQPMTSQILKVENRTIANHTWVDGMHRGSEVPNYITRYLATTKDRIAVLVTFSAHVLYYTKFSNDFFRAIESLRVIAMKADGKGGGMGAGGLGSETLGSGGSMGMASDLEGLPEEGDGGGGMSAKARSILGLALLLAAIGLFLVMKKKKKQKR
ncbi:MAG TPA: hypothetical protein VM432_10605 [Bdellovibrionales bacterium]|jgi:hypothetical protein|nr:hypothetical protein [Bdellovibrionales bacterium]